jgi:hypothetical protein
MFQAVEKAEAQEWMRRDGLGFSYLRLLPKPKNMRFIVNMGRMQELPRPDRVQKHAQLDPGAGQGTAQDYEPWELHRTTVNRALQPPFRVLSFERKR